MNLPFGILLALLLGITPFLLWQNNNFSELIKKLLPSFISAMIVWSIALYLGLTNILKLLFLSGATFALVSNGIVVIRNFRANWQLIGAPLSHVGVGLMLIGIVVSGNFSRDDKIVLDQGIPNKVMDYELTYQGKTPAVNGKDILKIKVTSRNESYTASPRFYYSDYNRSMMSEPDVQSNLLYDLYLSPQEIRQGSADKGDHEVLVIRKGETKEIGDLKVHFREFDMKSHSDEGVVKGGAKLSLSNGQDDYEVMPVIFYDQNGMHSEPAQLTLNDTRQVNISISQLNANEKAVELHFDGLSPDSKLANPASGEQLLLEVSKKPFMNILWIGTILIVAGAIIPLSRRIKESAQFQSR